MDYPKFIISNQKEESLVYKGLKEGFFSNAMACAGLFVFVEFNSCSESKRVTENGDT